MNRPRVNKMRLRVETTVRTSNVVAMNPLHGLSLTRNRVPDNSVVKSADLVVLIENEEDINAAIKTLEYLSQFFKSKK